MDNAVLGKSKTDIILAFGMPTNKTVEGSLEQWDYNLGQRTIVLTAPSTTNTSVKVNPNTNSATIRSYNYGGANIYGTYDSYIRILFRSDLGYKWETRGVDYTVNEPNNTGTAIAVIATLATSVILGLVLGNALSY